MSGAAPELKVRLHPRQAQALQSRATEILYGGAAGGGKSFLIRVAAIVWCAMIPGLQVYVFRRERNDLLKNHMEGPKGFRAMLAGWTAGRFTDLVGDEIRFWNGSRIFLCHCKDERDIYKYQGAEIHVLIIDELTHWTDAMYRFLRNRVRMVGIDLPEQYRGRFPRILCGSNPGNIGHAWVKETWIDNATPMVIRQMGANDGGMLRQFIPAMLEDNPSLAEDDPQYEARLQGLGSEALVKAMRYGDWNVVEGAFFDCWGTDRHVIRPFEVPAQWLRFRSFDWGFAKPFSVGWWAVSDGSPAPDGRVYPARSLIRYREWYGCVPGKPNTGLRLTAEQVADGIKGREKGDKITYGVADPACFAENGGPSHAERMGLRGVHFRPADNARVPGHGHVGGWDQMRARLIGNGSEPLIYAFSTCLDSIRTIPVLQHDRDRPEDLDSSGEDHAADEWRYACMSRPFVRSVERPASPTDRYTRKRRHWSAWAA